MRIKAHHMRRLITLVVAITLGVAGAVFADPIPPKTTAKSAILVDALTGRVLWEKACHKRLPPASTTKMMTAIIAMDRGKLDQPVIASEYATKTQFTSIHLMPGEQIKLRDILYAMLMRSANDSAVAVAENIAGSEHAFVDLMNEKARSLGAHDTHFVNPHGLNAQGHYSTTFDLAIIARSALQYPLINEVVRTKSFRLARSKNFKDVSVSNHNKFLWQYSGADGIKTGYTREAGGCLAASVTRNGWRLIAVVLGSKKASKDAAAIFDYGYKNFQQKTIARTTIPVSEEPVSDGVVRDVAVVPAQDIAIVLRSHDKGDTSVKTTIQRARAPIHKGDKLGSLTGYLNGQEIGTTDLVAAGDVPRTFIGTVRFIFRTLLKISILTLVGCIIYGRTTAKGSRRRRRGISKRGGNSYRRRTSNR